MEKNVCKVLVITSVLLFSSSKLEMVNPSGPENPVGSKILSQESSGFAEMYNPAAWPGSKHSALPGSMNTAGSVKSARMTPAHDSPAGEYTKEKTIITTEQEIQL